MNCCCICRAGDTEGGGLATLRVVGSTMGIALRVRWARGACNFVAWVWWEKLAGVKVLAAAGRTKLGVGWSCCWRGEDSGEPLESEDRSDPEE